MCMRVLLSGTGSDGGLGRLGGNSKVELGKGCIETLGELSKACDLGILHGFLALVLDFGNLKSSLDDLLLCVSGIEQHCRSLVHGDDELPSRLAGLRSGVFVQFEVACVCSHWFPSDGNRTSVACWVSAHDDRVFGDSQISEGNLLLRRHGVIGFCYEVVIGDCSSCC